MKFQQKCRFLLWQRKFGFVLVLLAIFVATSECKESEIINLGNAISATDDASSRSYITMQWCGDEDPPQMEDFNSTSRIFEERRDFSVNFTLGSLLCPPGVNSTTFTMDTRRPIREKYPFHDVEFSSTGYVRVGDHYYPHDDFCITKWMDANVEVLVCGEHSDYEDNDSFEWVYKECGANNPCLPKCCAMNKLWTISADPKVPKKPCQDPFENSKNVNPILYDRDTNQPSTDHRPVHYFRNRVSLGDRFVHHGSDIEGLDKGTQKLCFRFRDDGKLLWRNEHFSWVEVPVEDYCMEGVQYNGSLGNEQNKAFLGEERHYGVMIVYRDEEHHQVQDSDHYSVLYGVAFLTASLFLLLTFVVYALLWKEQKIQGWITMSHSVTMFFMYCFLSANHFLELIPYSDSASSPCRVTGILKHFFFLSNFCWLTVICFSLFWTFRGINLSNPRARNTGQYMGYVAFAWGLPLVFVTVSVVLDEKYSHEVCNMVVVPEYGKYACAVSVGALGLYMYYPVALLLTLNLIFFSVTSYKLYMYTCSTLIARENLNKNMQLFRLIAKLFFVMGFTWILEFISWFLSGAERTWYWAVADMFNILQAVAIFIIYVCKANVMSSLKKRVYLRRQSTNVSRRSGRSYMIGSRDGDTNGTNYLSTSGSGCEDKKNVKLKSLRKNPE